MEMNDHIAHTSIHINYMQLLTVMGLSLGMFLLAVQVDCPGHK